MADDNGHHIRVFVRTRPTQHFPEDVIKLGEDLKTVSIKLEPDCESSCCVVNSKKNFEWRFNVDGILHQSPQETVYSVGISPVISQAFEGYNACIMAYGQVGSGKSYTMVGPEDEFIMRGVIPRSITQIFNEIGDREAIASTIVRVSFVEIYNDRIIDLLAHLPGEEHKPSPLTLSESTDGLVSVNGLIMKTVGSEEEALNLFFEGEFHRTISYHTLNTLSSRSHVIFTIYLETLSKCISNADIALSKVHLVDLGGTERLNKSQPIGNNETEAKAINRSLSFLEQVLMSLSSPKRNHIPYRQCKLTHYLSDSLQTSSHIVLLANIRGEMDSIDETISTLKFVTRVRSLSINPVTFKTHDEEKLSQKYAREIEVLKEELKIQDFLHGGWTATYNPLNETQVEDIKKQVKGFLEGTIPELKISTVRQTKEAFNQLKMHISSVEKSLEHETDELKNKVDNLETKIQSLQFDQTEVSKSSSKGSVKKSVSYGKPDEVKETGIDDGLSITLGKAPANLKGVMKPSSKYLSIPHVSISEAHRKRSKVPNTGDGDYGVECDNVLRRSSLSWTGTPPPREEAFETFKNGRGKELHAVFLQNKVILAKKKKEIVSIKQRLKELNNKIIELQKEADYYNRDMKTDGSIMTTDGRMVLRECDYSALVKLKQFQSEFKVSLTSLEATRAEVPLCLEHVMQSRKRLLKEFESWFKNAFIGETSKPDISSSSKIAESLEDIRRVQEIDEVSNSAYHKANQRAMRRARAAKLAEKKSFISTV